MLGSFKKDARTRGEFLSLIPPQGTRRWFYFKPCFKEYYLSPATKEIVLENNKVIPEIFGSQDLNLKLIEKKFNVRITTRENQIKIKGEPDSLDAVETCFSSLKNYMKPINL